MKVLLVDDEPLVRRALSRAFASHGHTGHTPLLHLPLNFADFFFV